MDLHELEDHNTIPNALLTTFLKELNFSRYLFSFSMLWSVHERREEEVWSLTHGLAFLYMGKSDFAFFENLTLGFWKVKNNKIIFINIHTSGNMYQAHTTAVLDILLSTYCPSLHPFFFLLCPFSFLLGLAKMGNSNGDQRVREVKNGDICFSCLLVLRP